MTTAQLTKRLTALEKEVKSLRAQQEYQEEIDIIRAIREGLASFERGEGIPVKQAFAKIRKSAKRRSA